MITQYIVSLIKSCVITGFMSLLNLLGLYILFHNRMSSEDYFFPAFGILSSVVLTPAYFIAFLFPLSLIDKSAILNLSFPDLIRRYLPFVTFPLGILFCSCTIRNEGDTIRYSDLILISNLFFIAYFGLWSYIKSIKLNYE